MKKVISLNFSDFWPGFNKKNNFFWHLLGHRYQIELSDKPEYLIYSVFGNEHRNYSNAVKIFFTGENTLPDFINCDYALSFAYIKSERNYRFPLYGWCYIADSIEDEPIRDVQWCYRDNSSHQNMLERLTTSRCVSAEVLQEKEFCSFVVSNPYAKHRIKFFNKLSQYKKVNSGGKFLNNIGEPVQDKATFLKRHKFNIAFENSCSPGYTTEKLVDAYLSETVPIYWGNELIEQDFNINAFIHVNKFKNFDDVIKRIVELDNNDDQLLGVINQPLFANHELNTYVKQENVRQFFDFIFDNGSNRSLVLDPSYWVKLQSFRLRQTLRSVINREPIRNY